MSAIASQITSPTIVYSIVYSDADQRKHLSSASLAFVGGIHRGPVNSPHKWPVTRKIFPFDDVIIVKWYSGPLFTKRTDVLPPNIVKSRSCEIECCNASISLKFHRHIVGCAAAAEPAKFQNDWKRLNSNLAASKLHEILCQDVRPLNEQRPRIGYVNMMTSSNGTIFRVTGPLCGDFTGPGEFPTQKPVTPGFDVFFDLRPNKRLSKQPWGWWFETPSWSLWRQCNEDDMQWLDSKPWIVMSVNTDMLAKIQHMLIG